MKTLLFLTLTFLVSLANAQFCKDYIPNNWQDSRYTNHNSTITDKITGLMWKQCAEGLSHSTGGNDCATGVPSTNTWQEALQVPLSVNTGSGFAGYKDWRLPNVNELKSLAADTCYDPSINTTIFPNAPTSFFWSSSLSSRNSSNAWMQNFADSSNASNKRTIKHHVRLVRSEQ